MHEQSFQKARITLTAWYVGILAVILFIFSAALYAEQQKDFARIIVHRDFGGSIPRVLSLDDRDEVLSQVAALRRSFLLNILISDGLILLVGGGLSFFLAGKTLKPIQLTFERQKTFLADVSHEIRTPLAAIQTATEVALRSTHNTNNDYRDVLSQVFTESKRLTKMANDLLLLSRIESYTNKPLAVHIDLTDIVEKVIKEFSPLSKERKIVLVAHVASGVTVLGNVDEIKQLVMILLENSLKYTKPKGTVTVTLEKSKKTVLKIADTGIGIAPSFQDKIFERFYQVDMSRSTTGNGLGLAIAKRIADVYKTQIHLESTLGKGSEFTLTFPQINDI